MDNSNTGADADNAGKGVQGLELMTAYSPENFLPFPVIPPFMPTILLQMQLDGDSTSTDTDQSSLMGLMEQMFPYEHVRSFGIDYN